MAVPLKTIHIVRELREQASDLLNHARETKQRMEETDNLDYKKRLEHITRKHVERAHNLVSIGRRLLSDD